MTTTRLSTPVAIISTGMTVARLVIMCLPSARKVAASYSVIVRPRDSQVPHMTPATSVYSMMLRNWASLTNIAFLVSVADIRQPREKRQRGVLTSAVDDMPAVRVALSEDAYRWRKTPVASTTRRCLPVRHRVRLL